MPLRKPYPEVAAHRGAMLEAPQSTIPAYLRAAELGADMIELDARVTRDLEVVVVHDSTVDRFTNGSGKVSDLTLDEIRRLDAGVRFGEAFKGTRIPTLREALEFIKDRRMEVNVEIKDAPVEAVVSLVEEMGMEEQTMVSSPDGELLREAKQMCPRLTTMIMGLRPGNVELLIERFEPDAVNFNRYTLNEESYQAARSAGVLVYQSILGPNDNEAGALRAVELGAHILETDHTAEILDFLYRAGLRPNPK